MRIAGPHKAMTGFVGAAVAALMMSSASAQAASPHWTIVSSPNASVPQNNVLNGVSCVSSGFCMAVGQFYNGTNEQGLVESRSGGGWSVVSSPDTSESQDNILKGVSCVSNSFCIAAGDYYNGAYNQTLIETWNGSVWSQASSANTSSTQWNFLNAVSCSSVGSCMATGYYSNGTNWQTLTEMWNGATWSLISSPDSSSTENNTFNGVSCVSVGFCMAAGYYFDGTYNEGETATWNGSVWTLSGPNSVVGAELTSVTCKTLSFCVAAGYFPETDGGSHDQTVVQSWSGSGWTITGAANTSYTQDNFLNGVSCVSTSLCMADGYYTNAGTEQTLIAEGSSWALVSSPNAAGSVTDELNGLSCATSISCMSVGYYAVGSNEQTLIEKWNGTAWSVVGSPNMNSTQDTLHGISCVSSTFCMSVGAYFNGSMNQTLTEKWHGGTWNVIASPNAGSTGYSELDSVSCATITFCMAVGESFNGTLAEKWNGSSWTVVSSPDQSSLDALSGGVSCVSSTFCMAGGYFYTGTTYQTLIEKWNGSSWTVVSSPNSSASQWNFIDGITCTSASFCMSAGDYNNGLNDQTLIEKWNGNTWTVVSSPDSSPTQYNDLDGITCVSTTFCMAAGDYSGTNAQTLIEKWNGSTWSLVSSPNSSSTQDNYLYSLSCASSTFCMAVGQFPGSTNSRTLIEKWNGTAWSLVNSPNTSNAQDNVLYGVSCVSSAFCMAGGNYSVTNDEPSTLIERW